MRNETTAELAAADLIAVATALRDEPAFRFSELIDLCGVDYLGYGQTEWDTDDRLRHRFLARRGRRGHGPLRLGRAAARRRTSRAVSPR